MQDLYPSRRSGKPAILERLDPVVHARDFGAGPLPREAVERFERDGVLVLERLFPASEVAALRAEAETLRQPGRALAEGTRVIEPGYQDGDPGAVRSVFDIDRQCEAFAGLAADRRIADIARFLLDDAVYLHQSRLNYKPAFRGREFYWHSDFETWHTEDGMPRMRAVSASVMLTDNHPQAGPTLFIPGSQRRFVACVGETPEEHYRTSLRRQDHGVPDTASLCALAREGGIIAPAPPAGSLVLFDCNTLHGSASNITPFERVNAFLVFNAWSNRLVQPFGASEPRPDFIAHRDVDAPLRSPDRHDRRAA